MHALTIEHGTVCLSTLVSIAEAIFFLERRHTNTQGDKHHWSLIYTSPVAGVGTPCAEKKRLLNFCM